MVGVEVSTPGVFNTRPAPFSYLGVLAAAGMAYASDNSPENSDPVVPGKPGTHPLFRLPRLRSGTCAENSLSLVGEGWGEGLTATPFVVLPDLIRYPWWGVGGEYARRVQHPAVDNVDRIVSMSRNTMPAKGASNCLLK